MLKALYDCFSSLCFIKPSKYEEIRLLTYKTFIFEILQDTQCMKIIDNIKFQKTELIARKGEKYLGNIILHKNELYALFTNEIERENYAISLCIPIVFNMTKKETINVMVHND